MAKVIVTYTRDQLRAFTVKELATLDLYSKINPKGLSKTGIIKEMLNAQKAEQKASKAKSEIKKEVKPKVKKTVAKVEGVKKEVVKAKVKEVVVAPKSEKPTFHRPLKGRNPMTFRLN